MGDLLEQAASWLGRMRSAHLSRAVTYTRGDDSAQIAATVGRTEFQVDDGYGVIQTWQSRDYLVAAVDLVLAGETVQPRRGDRITDGGAVYEVLAPGKEDVFRFSDPYGVTLRIHTKVVGAV
jgi:hypothetical protein